MLAGARLRKGSNTVVDYRAEHFRKALSSGRNRRSRPYEPRHQSEGVVSALLELIKSVLWDTTSPHRK